MRIPIVCLAATLVAGSLLASTPEDYSWVQLQGGVAGHRSNNHGDIQPAFGLGLGTWLNGHVGLEGSFVTTWADYGHGKAAENHLDGSLLINPFTTPANVRPFLRLGLGGTSIDAPVSAQDGRTTRLNLVAGAGLQVLLGERMLATLEGRLVEIQSLATRKEAQVLAGIGWHWGGHSRYTPVAAAPAEQPVVVPAPAPVAVVVAPVAVAAQAASATQQYCTILDLQFAIDRDDLQPEDTENLAVLGTFMTRYPDTSAVIEGHTDNVGAAAHNLALSQRRADNVVAYLTGTLHIAASRLKAVGYGDTRPVADNGTQEGQRQNRSINAVIACVTDVEGLKVAPARMTMALYIDYDRNKADVKPQYDQALGKVAQFMKTHPRVIATMEGHTGNLQTSQEQALVISQLRAQNVVDYLVVHFNIDRSRLNASGFGQSRRVAYNTDTEGQQENRRVNIVFTYPAR